MTCEPGECRLDEDGACIVNFKKPQFSVRAGGVQHMANSLFSPRSTRAFDSEFLQALNTKPGHHAPPPRWVRRFFRWAHRIACAECAGKQRSPRPRLGGGS